MGSGASFRRFKGRLLVGVAVVEIGLSEGNDVGASEGLDVAGDLVGARNCVVDDDGTLEGWAEATGSVPSSSSKGGMMSVD